MKLRLIALLLCLAMIFSLSLTLVSCGGGGDENGDDTGEVGGNENGGNTDGGNTDGGNTDGGNTDGGNTDGGNTDGGNTGNEGGNDNKPEPLPPHTVTEKYLPSEISSAIASTFIERNPANGYNALSRTAGPYAFIDIDTLTNCKLKSITIPVMKTTAADEEGKHKFTIFVVSSSAKGLATAPVATHTVTFDAVENGLPLVSTNNVFKMVTLDLTEYNIVIGEGQTVAFYDSKDTICPAYLQTNANTDMMDVVKAKFPQMCNSYTAVGKEGTSYRTANNTLCIDIEYEKTYENIEVYADTQYKAALEALKALYAGKKISIVGDSISTYSNYSNDKFANATTEKHDLYYPKNDYTFANYKYTYWGRTLTDLGMDLCVNNSWSGARTYGGFRTAVDYNDRFPFRANELDRDDGTTPDVILVYLGINDVLNDIPMGDLYAILEDENDQRTDNEKVAAWFTAVLATAGTNPYKPNLDGNTPGYTSFEQAYALGIYTMMQNYPAAEVYCLTLLFNYHSNFKSERLDMANRSIKAIANYFGATVVDQSGEYSEISQDNVHSYGSTVTNNDCIHLTSRGHELMERLIIKTMAKKNGLI